MDRYRHRTGTGGQEGCARTENGGQDQRDHRQRVAQRVRKAKRIDLVAAEQDGIGKARAPKEHAKHRAGVRAPVRSEEHTSELQSLMRISYAVFCLKKKK